MKKAKAIICAIALLVTLTGCDYFEVEQKTLIDYRYTAEYTEYSTDSNGKTTSTHSNEQFALLYEYTYADGHTERRWEECTRFEYARAKEELGVVEP